MGARSFFRPSVGKAVFVALLVIAAMIPSSISSFPYLTFDVISQLQLILLLPWFVLDLPALSVLGMAVWLVYVYVIASIYAYAYGLIDRAVRKEFPHMNDMWTGGKKGK